MAKHEIQKLKEPVMAAVISLFLSFNSFKQMHYSLLEDEWRAWDQLPWPFVHENLNSPLMMLIWTVTINAPFSSNSKNSWCWWWKESRSKRIMKIDWDLVKNFGNEALVFLMKSWRIVMILIWFFDGMIFLLWLSCD